MELKLKYESSLFSGPHNAYKETICIKEDKIVFSHIWAINTKEWCEYKSPEDVDKKNVKWTIGGEYTELLNKLYELINPENHECMCFWCDGDEFEYIFLANGKTYNDSFDLDGEDESLVKTMCSMLKEIIPENKMIPDFLNCYMNYEDNEN